jgi:hypothetical protein
MSSHCNTTDEEIDVELAEAEQRLQEEENAKAEDGMKLVTPADLSALDRARLVNSENARIGEQTQKPKAGSSKAATTPKTSAKTPVNLARQVRNEELFQKTGKRGKNVEVAVSEFSSGSIGFSDLNFSRMSCATCV